MNTLFAEQETPAASSEASTRSVDHLYIPKIQGMPFLRKKRACGKLGCLDVGDQNQPIP